MKLDNVFKKTRIAVGRKNYITFTRRPEVPEGLLRKCNKCGGAIIPEDSLPEDQNPTLQKNLHL